MTADLVRLRAIANTRRDAVFHAHDLFQRQARLVNALDAQLTQARATLAAIGDQCEDVEIAAREASRDLELAVDDALDEECGCSSAPTRCDTCKIIEEVRPDAL